MTLPPLNHDHKTALTMLAYFYLQHQQAEKAHIMLEGLHSLWPNDPEITGLLGFCYLELGQYQAVLDTTASIADPVSTVWSLLRSKALWGLGQTAAARAAWQPSADVN